MILTITLNPAIDKTATVERFTPGAIHRPRTLLALPGGKGITVARTIKTLGHAVVASGFLAGHAGRFVVEGLAQEGIPTDFLWVPGETRTCLSILDQSAGSITELYEAGPRVTLVDLERLQNRLQRYLPQTRWVTLNGSLPPGLPAGACAHLVDWVHRGGARVLLDTPGPALAEALPFRPDAIHLNRQEARDLLGFPLTGVEGTMEAIGILAKKGIPYVVITLGGEGAMAWGDHRSWRIQVPSMPTVSPVGSGDAFVGGLVVGLDNDQSWPAALQQGAAASLANTRHLGAGVFRREEMMTLLDQVLVQS